MIAREQTHLPSLIIKVSTVVKSDTYGQVFVQCSTRCASWLCILYGVLNSPAHCYHCNFVQIWIALNTLRSQDTGDLTDIGIRPFDGLSRMYWDGVDKQTVTRQDPKKMGPAKSSLLPSHHLTAFEHSSNKFEISHEPCTYPNIDTYAIMDSTILRGLIVSTLDANTDVRRRAEIDLKSVRSSHIPPGLFLIVQHLLADICSPQAEDHPGFTDALLDILQAEQEAPVKLSSTITMFSSTCVA